ncbi:extracellular solute-binding protein [Ahrensia sp. R2A130]|uniref:extracellular solute-binding protein n=1 Tax=Ahrensia sp. R2A130 TaxID=744979 RepID=UPI0001E0E04C|nr:extracellular solute-binding protein [Ahrensia sp. R2A130]EFL90343.1 putative binding protein [Ahrensia sp. R2A130]
MTMLRWSWVAALSAVLISVASPAHAEPQHGIAMRGAPALPADYAHFPYANPDAPKGGRLVYGVLGSFDDLNPFDLKSIRTGGRGIWDPVFGNLVIESLLQRSRDEPFTLYGHLAEKVDMAEDRKSIEFFMNPKAKFADGQPVTVDDVIFTFELLGEKGRPPYNSRMKAVEKMEKTGDNSVKLTFNDRASRETPMLFGLMPVLPKHATDVEKFGESNIEPPLGSGPYTVSEVKPGERITYQRNPDYWAKDEPQMKGFHNFDTVRVDYYRNGTAQFEAFKKGLFEIYPEGSPAKWRTAYDFPAVTNGDVVKEEFAKKTPSGMLGFVFNTRRKPFDNRNVRKALAMLFDFEWANENLFFGAYTRTSSYWQNSPLSSLGRPASEAEKAILAPFPDAVSADVLDGTYTAPISDGSGFDRKLLRAALGILRGEGFKLVEGKLVGPDGKQLSMEMLLAGDSNISGADVERLALSYKESAGKLGIDVQPRSVDDAQYQARKGSFEFDLIVASYSSSLSPGAEQSYRWGSQSKSIEGSFNFAGTAEPAIDAAIETLLAARTEEEYVAAVRVYDRLLISGHYVIPLYHLGQRFVARRTSVSRPDAEPLYGPQYPTWWSTEEVK